MTTAVPYMSDVVREVTGVDVLLPLSTVGLMVATAL